MFACSMYPTNEEFLKSVQEEVRHQVNDLMALSRDTGPPLPSLVAQETVLHDWVKCFFHLTCAIC